MLTLAFIPAFRAKAGHWKVRVSADVAFQSSRSNCTRQRKASSTYPAVQLAGWSMQRLEVRASHRIVVAFSNEIFVPLKCSRRDTYAN
jgi:hypothetical protein